MQKLLQKLLVVPSEGERRKFPWDDERTKSPSASTLFVFFSDTGTKTDTDTDTDTNSDTARLLRRLTPRVFFSVHFHPRQQRSSWPSCCHLIRMDFGTFSPKRKQLISSFLNKFPRHWVMLRHRMKRHHTRTQVNSFNLPLHTTSTIICNDKFFPRPCLFKPVQTVYS